MFATELTNHAQRIQQRGLTREIVQFIFENGIKTNSLLIKDIFLIPKNKAKE